MTREDELQNLFRANLVSHHIPVAHPQPVALLPPPLHVRSLDMRRQRLAAPPFFADPDQGGALSSPLMGEGCGGLATCRLAEAGWG
jgi:hypothetical protein